MRRSIQVTQMYEKNKSFENRDVLYSAVTRFNVKFETESMVQHMASPKAYRRWLEQRVALFRTYCLAPMLQQSIKPHAWFVLFDREITPEIAGLLDELLEYDWMIPLFLGDDWGDQLKLEFRDVCARRFGGKSFDYSCSVRLDSDDSLNRCYFAVLDHAVFRLRDEWDLGEVQTVNFPYGAAQSHGRYLVEHQTSQFLAMFEPIELANTPYRISHRRMREVSDVWDVYAPQPMFIYHAHEVNISEVASYPRLKHQTFGDIPLLLEQFGLTADTAGTV